jgi:uncharacterized phage protein (TIGR02220 family)
VSVETRSPGGAGRQTGYDAARAPPPRCNPARTGEDQWIMGYSPVYRGIWKHEDLEGAPFEEKAFFIFLWSNDYIRPSGIYRASDLELSASSGLSLPRVRLYLADLARRLRIVRDGTWIFVRGYLARQPNHTNMLRGACKDVTSCSSAAILKSFALKYPLHSQWSADRLAIIGQPINEIRPAVAVAVAVTESVSVTELPLVRRSLTADGILDWLNAKTGRTYRHSTTNLDLIRGRLKDGIAEWQLKAIVSRKVREWKGTEQEKFLRPATLFNRTKCEQYLGELPPDGNNGNDRMP